MKSVWQAHCSILRFISTMSTFSVLNHWGHLCFYVLLLKKKANWIHLHSRSTWNTRYQCTVWIVLSVPTSEQNSFFPKLPLGCCEEQGIGRDHLDGMYKGPAANSRQEILLCSPTAIWWFSVHVCHHSVSNLPFFPPLLPTLREA